MEITVAVSRFQFIIFIIIINASSSSSTSLNVLLLMMKNGCWFSKSADLCSSRVQWPPSLSCPSSRCYSYAVSNTSPTIHETGRSFLFFFAFEIHKKKKKKGECRPSFIPPIIFPDTLDLSYSQYLRAAKINECLAAR